MSTFEKSPLGHSMTIGASTKSKFIDLKKKMNQLGYIEVGKVYYLEKTRQFRVKITRISIGPFIELNHHLVVKKEVNNDWHYISYLHIQTNFFYENTGYFVRIWNKFNFFPKI